MFWAVSNDYGRPRKITFSMTFQLRSSQIHRHKKGDSRIDLKGCSSCSLLVRKIETAIIGVTNYTGARGHIRFWDPMQAAKSKRRTLGAFRFRPPTLLVRDATGCGHQVGCKHEPIINRSLETSKALRILLA